MKTALIITYYFPPCNGAGPWRPYSWAQHFYKNGIYPTVVTRHWTGTEQTYEAMMLDNNQPYKYEGHEGYKLHLLPTNRHRLYKILNKGFFKIPGMLSIYTWLCAFTGYFNFETDACATFKDFLIEHLKRHTYDFILLTSPPINLLNLINPIKKHSSAKIIADFRDLWNNHLLSINYKPSWKQDLNDKLQSHYMRKYLLQADLASIITPSFEEIIKLYGMKTELFVNYNGFESEFFEQITKRNSDKFNFSVIGFLYPQMDLTIMIEGLKAFLKDKSPEKVRINFYGTASTPSIAAKISNELPADFLTITKRMTKADAIEKTVNSDVLFYPAWKGYRGIISTKIFDYLASGNIILLAPGDDDILDKLILQTQTGKIVNTIDEFVIIMNAWYKMWEKDGRIPYTGVQSKIEFYSRKKQAELFAQRLLQL